MNRTATDLDRPDVAAGTPRGSVAPWVYAAALVWWAASWNLRNSVLMSWSPVDPVWVGAVLMALCVVHRLGQRLHLHPAVIVPPALLVVAFMPGAALSDGESYGPDKVEAMLVTVLPAVVAALLLLDSDEARRSWVWMQALLGGVVAVATLEVNDPAAMLQSGRLALATVDTISTGRLVGAAVVALLLMGLASRRLRWWVWPVAAGAGMVLVQIGSRGPLLAVVVAVVVVVALGRCFAGRRAWPLAFSALVCVAGYLYAVRAGGAGGERILDSLTEGLGDQVRERLLADALAVGTNAPLGIGWGDFAAASPTGLGIANDAGVTYAHNVFAETFAEGGVLALLGFGLVVVLALARLGRLSHTPWGAAALGITLYWLLNAQVSSDLVGNRFMWLSLACGLAAYRPADVARAAGGGQHFPPGSSAASRRRLGARRSASWSESKAGPGP